MWYLHSSVVFSVFRSNWLLLSEYYVLLRSVWYTSTYFFCYLCSDVEAVLSVSLCHSNYYHVFKDMFNSGNIYFHSYLREWNSSPSHWHFQIFMSCAWHVTEWTGYSCLFPELHMFLTCMHLHPISHYWFYYFPQTSYSACLFFVFIKLLLDRVTWIICAIKSFYQSWWYIM